MRKKILIYSLIFLGVVAILGYFGSQTLAYRTDCPTNCGSPNYCWACNDSCNGLEAVHDCVCQPGQTSPAGSGHCAGTVTCGDTGQWTSYSCGSAWNFCEVCTASCNTDGISGTNPNACACNPGQIRTCGSAGVCNGTETCSDKGQWSSCSSDRNSCTTVVNGWCSDGSCVGAVIPPGPSGCPTTCNTGNDCTVSVCLSTTNQCSTPANVPDGIACTTSSGGTGTCSSGVCNRVSGIPGSTCGAGDCTGVWDSSGKICSSVDKYCYKQCFTLSQCLSDGSCGKGAPSPADTPCGCGNACNGTGSCLANPKWCKAPNYCRLGMLVTTCDCPTDPGAYPPSGNYCQCEPGETKVPLYEDGCTGLKTCTDKGLWSYDYSSSNGYAAGCLIINGPKSDSSCNGGWCTEPNYHLQCSLNACVPFKDTSTSFNDTCSSDYDCRSGGGGTPPPPAGYDKYVTFTAVRNGPLPDPQVLDLGDLLSFNYDPQVSMRDAYDQVTNKYWLNTASNDSSYSCETKEYSNMGDVKICFGNLQITYSITTTGLATGSYDARDYVDTDICTEPDCSEGHIFIDVRYEVTEPVIPVVAYAKISKDGVNYSNSVTVTQGVATPIYLSAEGSYDLNGWSDPTKGISKCEWNSDLNKGSPTFEQTINNPTSPSACNIGPLKSDGTWGAGGTITFNDTSGNYTYNILKLTDKQGAVSNVAAVSVNVQAGGLPPDGCPNCGCTDPITCPQPPGNPTTSKLNSDTSFFCPSQQVAFSWSYSDPNGDPQSAFKIQADDNSDFSSPAINTIQSSSVSSFTSSVGALSLGTTYHWRVAVEDSTLEWSNWSNVAQFATPSTCLVSPKPDFTLTRNPNVIFATILAGGPPATSTDTTITLAPINGFNSDVTLSASSDISGATYNFSANPLVSSKYSTGSVFNVKIPSTTTKGPHTITITGVDGGLIRTANVILNVESFNPGWREF